MDLRDFGTTGPNPPAITGAEDRRWWSLKDESAANSITATLSRMRGQQTARLSQFTIAARLYGNLSTFALAGQAAARYAQQYASMRDRISYNVVQSAVDTATAKIAKNRPRPYFLTTSGDYKQQRRAKKLNRFIEGVFYENKAYEIGPLIFRDGAVAGDGLVHVWAQDGKIRYERVLATELWVDEQEGMYGTPRQMHRSKPVDKTVLAEAVRAWMKDEPQAKIDEAVGWIASAAAFRPDGGAAVEQSSDLIEVRESWHLPAGPDAAAENPKGGAHVISIEGHVLATEPWTRDHFPFARFSWCPRIVGFWSQGGAEQVQQIQFEINKLLGVIQRSFELGGTFTVLVERGSKVPTEHINNRLGKILEYTGPNAPQVVTPTLVQPEILQHLLTLKNAAFEQFGISQLSATAQKPAGLNSGVALREYNDIESDRFQTIGHAYENFFLDLARLTIEAAKEIGARKSIKVRAPGRKFIETIDWRDVNLSEDSYVMQCFPVSSLPRDPAGRLQTIQEYMQAGMLTPRQGKRLLDFPDLDASDDISNAPEDWLTENLDAILDGEEFELPEPEDDLQLAKELVLQYIAHAKSQRVDEERIEVLRRYRDRIDEIEKAAAAIDVANQPQLPAGAPQAVPEAPPVSQLIPNVPGQQAAA